MSDRLSLRTAASIVSFALASIVAGSLLVAILLPETQNLFLILFRAPGRFLFRSFHVAGFYAVAVLALGGVLVLSTRVRPADLVTLVASVVPFFTGALAIRLLAGNAFESSLLPGIAAEELGIPLAITVSVLLFLIECAALYLLRTRLHRRWHERPRGDITSESQMSTRPRLSGNLQRISGLLSAPRAARDLEFPAETVTPAASTVPGSLVDFPDPDFPERQERDVSPAKQDEPDEDPELAVHFTAGRFTADGTAESSAAGSENADDVAVEADPFADHSYDDPDDLDDELDDGFSGEGAPLADVPEPRSKRYDVPVESLLREYGDRAYWQIDDETRAAAETLRVTLDEFGIQAEVTGIRKGPVITMFEILPAPGVKLSRIVNLSDNIALRLAASSVRIVAPIPGKHAVGIEIPNAERAIVGFAELLQEESLRAPQMEIPIALGKDIPGDAEIVDLTRMPHVLIAGATGSGKSVCVNSMICSILYRRAPHEVKLILIDPKIVELKFYNDIPHLLTPVITDPKRAFQALQYCIYEMERRYTLLDALQVRDIKSYNRKISAKRLATESLPYIVVVVDEFADLMATSGKELESTLARLAAMSRAVGIHLVLATQRPSTDVITGLIKANIPSRIAFMVASKVDSRIILDAMGAEKLLGRGDMLFTSAWDPFPSRLQGAFLSDEEVERVVEYVKQLGEPEYIDDEIFVEDDDEEYAQGELEDPLMEKAIEIVTTAGKASASYLQRRLKVGYNRAARMVEEMERLGIVGPQQGSKPREVIAGG